LCVQHEYGRIILLSNYCSFFSDIEGQVRPSLNLKVTFITQYLLGYRTPKSIAFRGFTKQIAFLAKML